MTGNIHSIETFGTVDGPGVRLVVFMQGCPMRCLYCHNPDTWRAGAGENVTANSIIEEYEKNRPFYSRGGITVTGGEPLMQLDFVTELFSLARERRIHTCIDTSGATFLSDSSEYISRIDKLLSLTDLVMLDIKHIDPQAHKALTGKDNSAVFAFARHIAERGVPIWIRHVLVRGYTDSPEHLKAIGEFMAGIKTVKAIDVIPYHTLGIMKYKELGIPYRLDGVEPTTNEELLAAKKQILAGYSAARRAEGK